MVRLEGSKGRVAEEVEAEASSHREATSHAQFHHHNKVLVQVLPALIAIQQQTLQFMSDLDELGQCDYASCCAGHR